MRNGLIVERMVAYCHTVEILICSNFSSYFVYKPRFLIGISRNMLDYILTMLVGSSFYALFISTLLPGILME